MNIAIVTHNLMRGDGQGRVNYELARHCLGRGMGVTLVAHRVAPELVEAGARWHPVRPRMLDRGLLHVRRFAARADAVVRSLGAEVDLVMANGYVLTVPHAVNACHFVHGAWLHSPAHASRVRRGPYGWYQGLYSRANARWERAAFGAAGTVVAVSDKVRAELVESGVPPAKVRVILNGVDLAEFHPGAASRPSLGLPEGVPLALFTGDIRSPRKNLDTVLRAFAGLPEAHLAVVGDATQSPYPAMAAGLGVGGRVHFLGYRSDVAEVMRAADVFVFPSRYEACSLVLLEAMASGLPVVTSRAAGGSELVTPAVGWVLENPEDVARLREAVQRLTAEPTAGAARAAARAQAERHGWDQMAGQYVKLFEEVVHARASRGTPAAMVGVDGA